MLLGSEPAEGVPMQRQAEKQEAASCGAMPDSVYSVYQHERNELLKAEQEYARNFDKYLLTLSSGALAISLTFLQGIIPSGRAHALWSLVGAWGLLTVTVVLVLQMMRRAQDGHEEFRAILDEECAKGGQRFWQRVRERQHKSRAPRVIERLNRWSLITFCAALVLLFIFTGFNLFRAEGN
jgi:hypothetical protein